MKIYKCDRCKKTTEPEELINASFKEVEYALCIECKKELDKELSKIQTVLDKKMDEFFNKK